jgi:UDP-xylose/UDP-N-acetylglucosamine transporter B4
LLTFAQFAVVALFALPGQLALGRHDGRGTPLPRLRARQIPLAPYALQVALFFTLSRLNNAAFAYDVPMPVHIVFRSGGVVVSLILGRLILGRR